MTSDKTLPDLTRDAALQLGDLVRNEFRLARAEAGESLKSAAAASVSLALGVAVAGASVTLALFALAYAIGQTLPMWFAAVLAAAAGGLLSFVLVQRGKSALASPVSLPKTVENVSRDITRLKETVSP